MERNNQEIEYSQLVWDYITNDGTPLPINLTYIANDICGIEVETKYLAKLSGKIVRNVRGGYTITINTSHPNTRQRFTLAHELAHFLIHRDLIGDGIVDDALYRSNLSNQIEIEANRVGAEIIMPTRKIRNIYSELQMSGQSISEIITTMAERFEVSEGSMRIKLNL